MSLHVAICAVLVIGGCRREEPREEAAESESLVTPVAAEAVQRGRLRTVIRVSGIITPAAGSEFIASAPEPAQILEVPHPQGDRVASGDVLVRFAMPSVDAELSRQRADISRAQAFLENARVTQSRSRDLAERGIISRREMENADNEVTSAQAEVARAETARQRAEASLARATIRAPFAGLVAQVLHKPGDMTPGIVTDPILRLIDPERLEITAPIGAADAPRVLPGAAARITSTPGTDPVRLTVTSRPAPGSGGGDLLVHLAFVEPTTLTVDTRVDVEIDGEERVDVVLVRNEVLVSQGTETVVFVAADGTAERRVVTTGLRDGEHVEVTSNLRAGEFVITRGQVGLADGAAISVDASVR
ncbi:MAG: efflux RND transporter periplasmic adaptor subunit [Acidobacteria bacterium]|nr:efflux RND transporter periplasmic adaptor subunit [Acidobacteriota bacterium]